MPSKKDSPKGVEDVSADRSEMLRWALFSIQKTHPSMRDARLALVPKHIDTASWRRLFGGRSLTRPHDYEFIVQTLKELQGVARDDVLFKMVLEEMKEKS